MSQAASNADIDEAVSQGNTAAMQAGAKTAPTAAEASSPAPREAEKRELRRRLLELEAEPEQTSAAAAQPPGPVADVVAGQAVDAAPAPATAGLLADLPEGEQTVPASKTGDKTGEPAADTATVDRAPGASTDSGAISVVQRDGSAPGDDTAATDSNDSAQRDKGAFPLDLPSGVSDKNEAMARRNAKHMERMDALLPARSPNRASTVAQTSGQGRPVARRVIPPARREATSPVPAPTSPAHREGAAPAPARTDKDDSDSDAMEEAQVDQTIDADGGSETNDEQDELQDMTVSDARIESQFIARLIGSYAGLGGRTGPRVTDDDWPVAAELISAWMAIEGNQGLLGVGRDVPDHTIDSLYHWAGRRERPAVLDEPEDVEEDYGDRVAHFWLAIRSQLAGDVLEMVGQNGLSTFIQAVMQWRPVEPDTKEWTIVVQDATMGLRELRMAKGADLSLPLANLISRVDKRRAAYAVSILEDRASSVTGSSGWAPARAAPARRSAATNVVKREPKVGAKTRNPKSSRRANSAAPATPATSSRDKKRRREEDSDDEGARAGGSSRASGGRTRHTRPRKTGGRS
ncbi:hypothetical protein PENSPDRAFT_672162 [Peniophora sp. CONT]|nr:hypothetical protein PENSPDRAFT_672162 [Peniophora sp. CONT]